MPCFDRCSKFLTITMLTKLYTVSKCMKLHTTYISKNFTILTGLKNSTNTFMCHLCCCFSSLFSSKILSGTPSVSNSLDPDQAQNFDIPDLGPSCLQKLSADDYSSQRVIALYGPQLEKKTVCLGLVFFWGGGGGGGGGEIFTV